MVVIYGIVRLIDPYPVDRIMMEFKDYLSQLFDCSELETTTLHLAAGRWLSSMSHDPTSHVYRILSGQIWIYQTGTNQECRLAEILGPGDWFGASALAHGYGLYWEAVAEVETELTQAKGDQLLSLLSTRPDAAASLIRDLAGKLREARQETARLIFDDCNRRLIKTLLRFGHSAAADRHEDHVTLHITHQQLAQAVGAARETISLALTSLRRRNLLQTGRNQLSFNPERLRVAMEESRPADQAVA